MKYIKNRHILSKYPIINKNMVYHIGEMNINKKKEFSHEGSGLSVSECPEEWMKIHRMDNHTVNKLSKNEGKFIDILSIYDNTDLENEIYKWGVKNNYVEPTKILKYCMYDDELESDICWMSHDPNKVLPEVVEDDWDNLQIFDGYKPTKKINDESLLKYVDTALLFDILCTIYFEKTQKDIDGIWWDQELDINKYSAPKGVIFNTKLSEWKRYA